MSWKECEKTFIRKVEVDSSRISSIIESANKRYDFVKSINVNDSNISFVFEGYYEVIKELLIALMLSKGMRSKNHQCLFTFFAKEYNYDAEVSVIKQMNYLRNRLGYYGELVDGNYFKENYKSFEEIVGLLLKLLK